MEETILVNYYTINEKDYIIINELDYNDYHYVYLVNENDEKDIMIRRVINDVLEPLDSEEELNGVLKMFLK